MHIDIESDDDLEKNPAQTEGSSPPTIPSTTTLTSIHQYRKEEEEKEEKEEEKGYRLCLLFFLLSEFGIYRALLYKGGATVQTEPPTVPVSDLFKDGVFPIGEEQDYKEE
jgi:hypothetical protein